MIKRVAEKDKENFNKAANHPLQSWEWGEFRKKAGNQVIRLAGYQDKKLTTALQIMIHGVSGIPFPIGTLIKGPKPTEEMIKSLKDLMKEENAIFIKLEPNFIVGIKGRKRGLKSDDSVINLLRKSGAVAGRTLFTPTSFWIDLTKSEDKLLKSFHPKTRYNIRLAQKKGVKVAEDNSKKAFDKYIDLTRQTVERQGFYAHTEKYHRLMWQTLHENMVKAGGEPIARLLTARYSPPSHKVARRHSFERRGATEGRGGEIITCWIVFVWHDFLYYPYGASSDKHRNVMANNLIMWEAIRYGKKLGLKTFDLWGREPGKGFTKFKEGYDPQIVEFLGTWDLVTSSFYYPYRAAEAIRWLLLRSRSKLSLTKPKF
ncbi:MAG: lipid II:glycine glycyltransferase FemX [Patescibacteria group bacterium]